jgi:AraC-like DNA-binding protein
MQRLVMSTDDVPEADRFSYFREAIAERYIGVRQERWKGQDTPFSAHIVGSIGATFTHLRIRTDAVAASRRSPEIARIGWEDSIWFYREIGSGAWYDFDRREFVTRPGDLLLSDPAVAEFETKAPTNRDFDLWVLPRKLFDPHLPVLQRPRSLVLDGNHGLSGVVKAYIDGFGRHVDTLGDGEAGLIADNFCRLLAVACGASAGEQQEAMREARLAEAKRHVQLHLADPGLAPEKVAAALKISVRQLHLLFEPSGESFGRYVTRKRLEECRAAIMNPIGDRSVTDIALAWGFNSLRTFNRTFRQAYDTSPGELRGSTAGARSID